MNISLVRQLRELTNAPMADCKSALLESGEDLEKAIDIIKIRGQAISDARSGKIATEGVVVVGSNTSPTQEIKTLVEINSETDFVARNPDFIKFAEFVSSIFLTKAMDNLDFSLDQVEDQRQKLLASTKENIIIRRWVAQETKSPQERIFSYLHSNNKIGILLTLRASSKEIADSPEFNTLGLDLAMQVCAMNPLAVSSDRLFPIDQERQKIIFETQLKEEKKPEKMWGKILEGKLTRWYKDVCLLDQESIVVSKTPVKKVVADLGTKLGGTIEVINFVRYEVGEGLNKKTANLAKDVSDLIK